MLQLMQHFFESLHKEIHVKMGEIGIQILFTSSEALLAYLSFIYFSVEKEALVSSQ